MSDRSVSVIGIDGDAVRGEQPQWVMDLIDWRRLALVTRAIVEKQPDDVREAIYKAAEEASGSSDQLVGFELTPFDGEGWTMVAYRGVDLMRLHVSNLLPLYDPYKELPEPEPVDPLPGFYL